VNGHAGGGGQRVPEAIGDGQRLVVQCQRVTQGERRRRFLAGSQQVVERASPVFREREMMGEDLVVLGEPVGVELFDGAADQTVQLATALYEQRAIGDVLGEGVLEAVRDLGEHARLVDQLHGP